MKISAETLYLRKYLGDRETIRVLAEAGFDCIDYTMDHMTEEDSPLNAPDYREYAAGLLSYAKELGVTFHQAHAPFEFEWEKENVLENIAVPRIIRCLEIASVMGIDTVIALLDGLLGKAQVNPVVHSLVIDGVCSGVGSVLSLLPTIVTMFFFLSILEDTGYIARVAFVMDRLLRKIGLSGRSIVPMLIGFGCSVPAIMATRTLSSERDHKMTILLVPFMSCTAKLPIYTLMISAFFP